MTCPICDDGDGFCAFPYYGVAPHVSDGLAQSRILSKEEWPENYVQDKDNPSCGTYTHCLARGDGEKP